MNESDTILIAFGVVENTYWMHFADDLASDEFTKYRQAIAWIKQMLEQRHRVMPGSMANIVNTPERRRILSAVLTNFALQLVKEDTLRDSTIANP